MGTIGGWLAWNSTAIFGFGARQCHKQLAQTISTVKVDTLSKARTTGDVYVEITRSSKGAVYVEEFINGDSQGKKQLAKRKVTVAYKNKGAASNYVTIGDEDSSKYTIYFNRSTGAMIKSSTDQTVSELEKIKVSAGNHEYIITVWPKTGKISYKL